MHHPKCVLTWQIKGSRIAESVPTFVHQGLPEIQRSSVAETSINEIQEPIQ